jgi:ketopantoate hydroxymethyltransferase
MAAGHGGQILLEGTTAGLVRAARARAQALKAQVSAATSRYVALCRAAGIPVRDIAFRLGITPQRVSQIGLKDNDDQSRCNECQRFYDEDSDERSD